MRIVYLLFLLNFFPVFSQSTIKFTFQDPDKKPISLVNVKLQDKLNNKFISYKQSDLFGNVEFFIVDKNVHNIIASITCLGYKSLNVEINTTTTKFISNTIILEDSVSELKEVVIKANFSEVSENNDTIKYNLKKLLNGSERNLKDIIEKLPGLNIDDNGKITYKGKVINDLLIEGDEFYGSQHQLATENIKSEMIDKIEILKNFKNFSSIKGFDNQNKTALNLTLKEKFKNTLKGNVDGEYGYKNRYRQHNFIYNFGGKLKTNVTSDINNTNNQTLSVTDFLELKKGINTEISDISSSSIIVEDDLPSFLFSEDDVNRKKIQFYSLNLSNKLSKKIKISGFSYFGILNQDEFQNTSQIFLSTSNFSVSKSSTIHGKSVYGNNKFQLEYKPNERNYYTYAVYFNFNKVNQESYIQNQTAVNESLFYENNFNSNVTVGQLFHYKIKFNNNLLLEYNISQNSNLISKTIDINSNEPFLNLNFLNVFSANQFTKTNINNFGTFMKLTYKYHYGTINSKLGSLVNMENLQNNINEYNPNFSTSIALLNTNNFAEISFNKKKKNFFSYSLGVKGLISTIILDGAKIDNLNLLPFGSITLDITKNTNLNLTYKRDFGNTTIIKSLPISLIEDFRTVTKNTNNFLGAILPVDVYNISGSNTNFQKNLISFFGVIHTIKKKQIDFNYTNSINDTQKQNQFINQDNSTYLYLNVERKLKKIPWAIKFETLQSYGNREVFNNNIETEFSTIQNKYNLEIKSYFKSNFFNLFFGIDYSINNSKNKTNNVKNNLSRSTYSVKTNGNFFKNKLFWEINSNFIKFDSQISAQKIIYEINPSLSYKINNWNLNIRGINILNIKENNIRLTANNQPSFFETTQFSSLPGFITFGSSYSF